MNLTFRHCMSSVCFLFQDDLHYYILAKKQVWLWFCVVLCFKSEYNIMHTCTEYNIMHTCTEYNIMHTCTEYNIMHTCTEYNIMHTCIEYNAMCLLLIKVNVTLWRTYACTEGRQKYSSNTFATLALEAGGWSTTRHICSIPGKDPVLV